MLVITQQRIYQDVLRLLADEQLYKDPSLKVTDLAGRLHLTPNYLSRIINQEAKKTPATCSMRVRQKV